MRWNPEVTVAAVVERDGYFLIVEERINGHLVLNQPAGHLEDRETLIAAVVRETREETAWRLTPQALIGTYLWRNPANGRTILRFTFCGTVDDHHPGQPLDTGIVRTHWLSHEQLVRQRARLRSPLVLRCLDDYLGGVRQALESVATLEMEAALQVAAVVNL